MPRSMTGYGNSCTSEDGLSVTVEIRSVNNRYLDFNFRLPRALYSHEHELRELIKKRIQRGRISIFANVGYDDNYEPGIKLDIARVRVYARELKELQQELNLAGELKLDHLISSGDIFRSEEDDSYTERLWSITRRAFTSAMDQYVESSTTEAEALCADINLRIKAIKEQLRIIETDAVGQAATYQKKLSDRLSELLDDNRIDRSRLETEIALAADKLDISEEIVRLDSHIQMFNAAISGKDAVGKKLGFILQEMGREANTIASKSWSIFISEAAIKIKELLEQIREQVQNLE
ncbi:MAG: YicC family protein [Calditrichaeota bacterium]|nr:YicC family protein [Calditrichota bacterium]